jgi:hypothetical protein
MYENMDVSMQKDHCTSVCYHVTVNEPNKEVTPFEQEKEENNNSMHWQILMATSLTNPDLYFYKMPTTFKNRSTGLWVLIESGGRSWVNMNDQNVRQEKLRKRKKIDPLRKMCR